MKNKQFFAIICFLLCAVMATALFACGKTGGGDDQVTVAFKNGDTVIDTVTVKKGSVVAPTGKPVAAPAGKAFKSWQKGDADYDFSAAVEEDLTLVASFKNIQYTVTFKDAGGNILKTLRVDRGAYISEADVPAAPDRGTEHKTFIHWVLESDPLVTLDCDSEVLTPITYIPFYEAVRYTVTIKNAADGTTIDTRTVAHGEPVGDISVPGHKVVAVRNGEADWKMTDGVTADTVLTVTLEESRHKMTYRDADGKEIGTTEVLDGSNTEMPMPADGTYWTLTAEEYAKLFGVRADTTVTVGTTSATPYQNKENWLTWEGGVTEVVEKLGAKFDHWTKNGNGTYNCPQNDGNYFTLTGDFARLTFNLFAGAGDAGYYDIFVDDVLVRKLTFDNSEGSGNKQAWVVALEKTMLPAGQHTIKIVAHTKTQITAVNAWYAVRKSEYDVTFKNGESEVGKVTVPAGAAVAKPSTDPTPGANQEFLYWSLDEKTEYDFTQPVNSDITLKAVFRFLETYEVTFKRADGTEITKVTVGKGLNAAMPALPDANNYWTATAAEYAKMFNVTENREVTLDVIAKSNYKNLGAGTFSIANEANINTVEGWGFDFTNWKIRDTDGNYGVYEQESGAKITITANLCKVAFATQVEAGKTCTYKIYIDGHLHSEVTVDNSDGETVKKANGYDVFCQPETFPAGVHTVVIEVEGAGTIHAATIVQYVAPVE